MSEPEATGDQMFPANRPQKAPLPGALRIWWNDPDRELMRREFDWTVAWLRGPGLWPIGAFVAVQIISGVAMLGYAPWADWLVWDVIYRWVGGVTRPTTRLQYSVMELLDMVLRRPEYLLPIAAWGFLLRNRTLRFLRRARIRDLLGSPSNPGGVMIQSIFAPTFALIVYLAIDAPFRVFGIASDYFFFPLRTYEHPAHLAIFTAGTMTLGYALTLAVAVYSALSAIVAASRDDGAAAFIARFAVGIVSAGLLCFGGMAFSRSFTQILAALGAYSPYSPWSWEFFEFLYRAITLGLSTYWIAFLSAFLARWLYSRSYQEQLRRIEH